MSSRDVSEQIAKYECPYYYSSTAGSSGGGQPRRRDPDHNIVELNVNNYDDEWTARREASLTPDCSISLYRGPPAQAFWYSPRNESVHKRPYVERTQVENDTLELSPALGAIGE